MWSQVNQADTSITYSSGNVFLYEGDCLASYNTIGGTQGKTWLLNHASMEDVPDVIGGRGSKLAQRNLTVGWHAGLVRN